MKTSRKCGQLLALLFASMTFGAAGDNQATRSSPPTKQKTKSVQVETEASATPAHLEMTNEASVMPSRRMFGSTLLHVGIAQPTFTELVGYSELYGKPSPYPVFGVDYYPWDWFITPGLGFHTAYIRDTGHAAMGTGIQSDGSIVPDPNSKTELTLIPLQVQLSFQMSPFRKKWIVASAWVGLEHLYFQEARVDDSSSPTPTSTPTPTTSSGTTTDDGELVNRGWKNGRIFGASLNFMLNYFDERSVLSLAPAMGLGAVYIGPFFEIVQSTDSGASFSRRVIGINFNFESVN